MVGMPTVEFLLGVADACAAARALKDEAAGGRCPEANNSGRELCQIRREASCDGGRLSSRVCVDAYSPPSRRPFRIDAAIGPSCSTRMYVRINFTKIGERASL